MNSRLLIVFFAFLVAYYVYYTWKSRRDTRKQEAIREAYLEGHPDLSEEQTSALAAGLPWKGMGEETLIALFGEPRRRRLMDPASGRVIWSYRGFFVFLEADMVVAWKTR